MSEHLQNVQQHNQQLLKVKMDNYIYTTQLSELHLREVRQILKRQHVRRGYAPATVYRPKLQQYLVDENRRSFKTTFNNRKLKKIIRPYLAENIIIPDDNHIDLNYYRTGHYFREHKDFVPALANNSIQLTIIIGLLSTPVGGTSIRLGEKVTTYHQSIIKGGLLAFNSRLPHAGETVRGEKEIIVLTGYLFKGATSGGVITPTSPLVYHDYYSCIAVYRYNIEIGVDPVWSLEGERDNRNLWPTFYIYQGNRLRWLATRKNKDSELLEVMEVIEGVREVNNFEEEELELIGSKEHYRFVSRVRSYWLSSLLNRPPKIYDIFCQLELSKSNAQEEIIWGYESDDDFCNGWEGGGGGYSRGHTRTYIEDEYTILTCSKRFSFTLPNSNYYSYWLTRIGSRLGLEIPNSIYPLFFSYLIL